jgi:NitT/TauT family transport system substrate-binding protein
MKRADLLSSLTAAVAFPSIIVGRADAQDLPKIVVAGPAIDDFKTVFYGIRAGIFRKYGVAVETLITNSGSAAMASVAGGSAQVAFTSLPAVLQAYLRGLPFRVVSPAQLYLTELPNTALFVKRDSAIRGAADLAGKTIAVQSIKDLIWAATMNWLDTTGGDSKSVKVIELPNSVVGAALAEGRIDAGNLVSPFSERAMEAGQAKMLAKNCDSIAKRFQLSVFVATADYVGANTDTMRKFVRAMHDCIVYTNTHLPETVELVASYSGADAAIVAKSVRTIDPEFIDPRDMQPVINVAYKYKLIDRVFPADEIISAVALRGVNK